MMSKLLKDAAFLAKQFDPYISFYCQAVASGNFKEIKAVVTNLFTQLCQELAEVQDHNVAFYSLKMVIDNAHLAIIDYHKSGETTKIVIYLSLIEIFNAMIEHLWIRHIMNDKRHYCVSEDRLVSLLNQLHEILYYNTTN
ncbi:MAG: hypothetical protein V1838_01955 [Patescibacteria group bacterium]